VDEDGIMATKLYARNNVSFLSFRPQDIPVLSSNIVAIKTSASAFFPSPSLAQYATHVGSSELKHVIPLTKPSLGLGLYARVLAGRGPDQPKRTQAHSLKGRGLQGR
jgi:hypothetical protein